MAQKPTKLLSSSKPKQQNRRNSFMKDFARFMAGTNGRIIRGVIGLVLIGIGLILIEPPLSIVVALIGLIPLTAGVFDFCLLTPLFGMPFKGEAVRRETGTK
jgi:purine-cytosine permease-like protein